MKNRGKGVEIFDKEGFSDNAYPPEVACTRHPYSPLVGVCASCLKERLASLTCSDCGERRVSSCSCSEISSNRNSVTTDGGRTAFLLDNESRVPCQFSGGDNQEEQQSYLSKTSVEIKRKNGFWKIGKLFQKKIEKKENYGRKSVDSTLPDTKRDGHVWLLDLAGLSRTRSLRSFRGGGAVASDDASSFSAGWSSISGARSSGFNGAGGGHFFDPERTGVIITDVINSFEKKDEQERDDKFGSADDSEFIDLKFHFPPSKLPAESSSETKLDALSASNTPPTMTRACEIDRAGWFDPFALQNPTASCKTTTNGDVMVKCSRKKSWKKIILRS